MLNNANNKNYSNLQVNLLVVCVFLCNISQRPAFWGNTVIKMVYFFSLGILFVTCIPNFRLPITQYNKNIIALDLFLGICWIFNGLNGYIDSKLSIVMNMAGMLFLVGYVVSDYVNINSMLKVAYSYCISSMLLGLEIFITTFRGVNWLNSMGYLYSAKNSMATILLCGICFALVYIVPAKKVLGSLYITFCCLLILMMKARANIVALIGVLFAAVFLSRNKIYKYLGTIALIVIIVLIFNNDYLYKTVIEQIMMNNRSAEDLTAITGSRLNHFDVFLQTFPSSPFIGTGGTYLESFPLAALLSYGVFLGIPMILIALYPIRVLYRANKYKCDKQLIILLLLLSIAIEFNGLLEQLAPFGPGVKCYALWLVTGIVQRKVEHGYVNE